MDETEDDTDRRIREFTAVHGRAVESVLASIEYDRAEREDLWSEVFVTAFLRMDQLESLSSDQVRGWLIRTARNLTANAARRSNTRMRLGTRLSAQPSHLSPSAESSYIDGAAWNSSKDGRNDGGLDINIIQTAWRDLDDSHRQVLVLAAAGHDGPSIASTLDISPAAARSRLMRARRAFLNAYSRVKEDCQ
ncbi:MAG: sigma factor [Microthrixaceae bacterium]